VSTADAFAKIFRTEGVGGFYRGFGAILLTVIPANMCYFSGYELGKRLAPREWGMLADLTTATIAQTVAGIAFCPIDIVKQRVQTAAVMAAQQHAASCGGPHAHADARITTDARMTPLRAAQEVWSHQGLKGFYRGFLAMNALWMPWNLIYLTLYESSKRRIYHWQLQREGHWRPGPKQSGAVTVWEAPPMSQILPLWAFPLCSSSCAAVAAVVTHPVDVVKTRLQVMTTAEHGRRRLSAVGVANDLWAAEGLGGFARGLLPRVGTLSMGSSLSWCVYELVKRQLSRQHDRKL
jgi:hypothetical protein